jgi:hypothetical protein
MQVIRTDRGLWPPVGDYVLAGSVAVLSIAVIVSAVRMPHPEGWREAPGLFPLICGVGLLVMAAILALAAWRRPAIEAETADGGALSEQAEPLELGRTLLVGGSVVVYALVLIPLMGYTLATLVYLCSVIWYFWRGRLVWVIMISLGATAFLSQTFKHAFSIILP